MALAHSRATVGQRALIAVKMLFLMEEELQEEEQELEEEGASALGLRWTEMIHGSEVDKSHAVGRRSSCLPELQVQRVSFGWIYDFSIGGKDQHAAHKYFH